MKKISTILKKSTAVFMLLAFAVSAGGASLARAAAAPNWDTSGNYVIALNYLGTDYPHDLSLTQDIAGNLTGNGGSPAGANTYTYVLTSGTVSGDTIDFLANYTATPDAVTPQTTMHVIGTVAPDGTISGTWSDNYNGGAREGTFTTTSGKAASITNTQGQIGGTVEQGTGALQVTSIESTDTTGTADGTFPNGWKYTFNITLPTNEQGLAMKFSDWLQTGGAGTIPAGGNIRISSAQADNGNATITETAANTYSTPNLNMVTDLDPTMDGIQVKVLVETAIPAGTPNGNYTTNYGVRSQ